MWISWCTNYAPLGSYSHHLKHKVGSLSQNDSGLIALRNAPTNITKYQRGGRKHQNQDNKTKNFHLLES